MRSEGLQGQVSLLGGLAKIVRAFLTRRVTMHGDQVPYVFTRVQYGKLMNWALAASAASL